MALLPIAVSSASPENQAKSFTPDEAGWFQSRVSEMKICKGDTVEVISGSSKGTRGTVLVVDPAKGTITVEGVNRVYKHVRRGHPKSPQGGRLHVELPIEASNVQLLCPETDKPTRVGVRVAADGSKELFARRSGAKIRNLGPAPTAK